MTSAAPAPAAPAATPAPAPAAATPPKVVTALDPPADPPAAPAPAAAAAPPADPAAPPVTDPATPPATPEWRTRMAKGDEKLLKRLERYATDADVANALVHAQDRIAKGIKPTLDANATPEQVKEYRTLLGVPEKPEDYKLELAGGRVVGDEDRPMVDAFLKEMHAAHAPPALVNAAINAYYARQDAAIEAREDLDLDQKVACTTQLKEDFGSEFKENMLAVAGLLDILPTGVGDALRGARLADGTALFNDPNVVRGLVQLARDLNPAASVVPGSGGNAAQTVAEKIKALTDVMATRDLTPAERKQLTELNEAQERLAGVGKLPKAA